MKDFGRRIAFRLFERVTEDVNPERLGDMAYDFLSGLAGGLVSGAVASAKSQQPEKKAEPSDASEPLGKTS